MLDVDLEPHPALALDAVVGVGEEVVRALVGQRDRDAQRLPELVAAPAVLEEVIVGGVVDAAGLVGREVVSLDHGLVGVRVE